MDTSTFSVRSDVGPCPTCFAKVAAPMMDGLELSLSPSQFPMATADMRRMIIAMAVRTKERFTIDMEPSPVSVSPPVAPPQASRSIHAHVSSQAVIA